MGIGHRVFVSSLGNKEASVYRQEKCHFFVVRFFLLNWQEVFCLTLYGDLRSANFPCELRVNRFVRFCPHKCQVFCIVLQLIALHIG